MLRLKGRVIGESGKSRKTIEDLSDTQISVYGKTIGIIGEAENTNMAKKAIDMLLTGAPHSTVFRILERWRRDLRRREHLDFEM
jgi:ribosomal RNA assembly protein